MESMWPAVTFEECRIDDYWDYLARKGFSFLSLQMYRRVLRRFYEYLPGDKLLDADALIRWEADCKICGYSETTIQAERSVVSGFLEFLQGSAEESAEESVTVRRSVLTRQDYLRLLRTARSTGRQRAYLLIKTLVNVGVRSRELAELTVETVRAGGAWVTSHGIRHRVAVPEQLQSELLAYAAGQGITEGPVFATRNGAPLLHSAVWKEIKKVCREAGLENDMGNPRNLYLLYLDTYQSICRRCPNGEAWQEYEQLLSEEDASTAWNTEF